MAEQPRLFKIRSGSEAIICSLMPSLCAIKPTIMLSIGLIDNFAIVRLGLAMILQRGINMLEIQEANTLDEFVSLPRRSNPDLLVFGNNTEEASERVRQVVQIRNAFPTIPLIVYDDKNDESMIIPYFSHDVKGYLTKPNIANDMLRAVLSVSEGKTFLCPVMLDALLDKLLYNPENAQGLTRRELEIARYITEGMRTSWIAKKLGRKPSTVSTIKHNIYKKMAVDSAIELRSKLKNIAAIM